MPNVLPLSLYADRDAYTSATLIDWNQEYTLGIGVAYDPLQAVDSLTAPGTVAALTMYPQTDTGDFVPTFFNDWYNRVHFIPSRLDLGNLLSSQNREVILWNAFLEDVNVSSFGAVNADGISVTQPIATPYNAIPLSMNRYILAVNVSGPPSILASLHWTIEGVDYTVPITGRRTVIWPFGPNWKTEVEDTLEYLTHVETAFDRTEQRFAGRAVPRRILEYTTQITGRYTQLFESYMFGWADRLFAVPLWQEPAKLNSAAGVGDVVLAIDTAGRSFKDDGLLVVFQNPLTYEAMEIDTVSAGSVTLKKGLDFAWAAGTRVYPVMISKLEQRNRAQRVAEDKLIMPVRFVGSPAETDPNVPALAAASTYEGIEVFVQGTNWGKPMDVEYATDYDVLDSDSGIFSLSQRADFPEIVKGHSWLLKSTEEAYALRGFFGRRRGRLVPAWIPSGTIDFTLAEPVVETDSVITVLHNDYGQLVGMHPARKHVIIQMRGGTHIIREISGYTNLGNGNAELSFTTAVGATIQPAQVRRISFLGLYRAASDAVTFSWKTTEVAVLQASFVLTKPAEAA